MSNQQLLAEVEDLLRTTPPEGAFGSKDAAGEEAMAWTGRVAAAIKRWDMLYFQVCDHAIKNLHSSVFFYEGYLALKKLLYQARADLRMELGLVSVVVPQSQVFDYFDELRKLIQVARSEVFFVDPYLDAEFVSRYLPQVAPGVAVRLLGGAKKMGTLIPAVKLYAQQSGLKVQVRSSGALHDRYLFVDEAACYLSGASFKDGAKNAPVVVTQISDAFQAMWDTYNGLWQGGEIEL